MRELLIRVDERVEAMGTAVGAIKRSLEKDFVSQKEFWPVRTLVYSAVGLILVSFMGALVAFAWQR